MEDQGPAGSSHVDEPSEVSELEASPLRSCWEFASVVQFCRLFGSTLKIRPFSADLLERAVLHPATHPIFLSDLCVKLLRANVQQPPTEKELDAWNEQLARRLACNWPVSFESDPLETEAFQDVQPITRARILYALCDWRIHDCPIVKEAIRSRAELAESTGELLRDEPIGEDAQGSLYFFFSKDNEDCRIYKEQPPLKQGDAPGGELEPQASWQTVTTTVQDVQRLADRLASSQHEQERALHTLLTGLIPALQESEPARRRAEEKAARLEAAPRKRSGRLVEVQQKRDQEERQRREQEEQRRQQEEEAGARRKEEERLLRVQRRQEEEERRRLQALEEQRKISGLSSAPQPSREERMQQRERGSSQLADGASPASSAGVHGSHSHKRARTEAASAGAQPVAAAGQAGAALFTSSGRPVRPSRLRQELDVDDEEDEDKKPAHKPARGRQPPALARGPAGGSVPRQPQARRAVPEALPLILERPTPVDLPCPRRTRTFRRRQPRTSRASINRLRQAAAGTLPLGGFKSIVAQVASPVASGSASGGEQDLGSCSSDEEQTSQDTTRKNRKQGRQAHDGRHAGGRGSREQQQGYGGGMQAAAAMQQRQALLQQLAAAPPHVRQAMLQQYMQQQQMLGMGLGGAPPASTPTLLTALPREQQHAAAAALMSRLTPQQRHALQQLSPAQQLQELSLLYQRTQQVQQQQQQMLEVQQQQAQQRAQLQAVLSSLSPTHQAQLAAMPPQQQQAAIHQMLQQQALAAQEQRIATMRQLHSQAATQGSGAMGGHPSMVPSGFGGPLIGGGGQGTGPGYDMQPHAFAGLSGLQRQGGQHQPSMGQQQHQPGQMPMDFFGGGSAPKPAAAHKDEAELQDAVKMFLDE